MIVISGTLVRVRTRQVAFVDTAIAGRPREVARRPAKVAQMLGPDIQEAVLGLEAVDGVDPMSQRGLRAQSKGADWAEQQEIWGEVLVGAAG